MNTRSSRRCFLWAAVIAVVLFGPGASRAEAYIDPGTGSHLLSTLGIMVGVVSTGFIFGLAQVRRCGAWFLAKLAERRGAPHDSK